MKTNSSHLFAFLSVAVFSTLPSSAEIVWPGPNQPGPDTLALFHFDETGQKVVDSGLRAYQLTLGNESARSQEAPTWSSSPSGKFLTPTGDPKSGTYGITDDLFIQNVDFNKGLTISFWYRTHADKPQGGELFQMEQPRARVTIDDFGAGGNGRIRLIAPGTEPEGSRAIVDAGAEPAWRHAAVVFTPKNGTASQGGDWTLYQDGQPIGSFNDTTDYSADTDILMRIGGNIWNNGPLQGVDLDEFLVANQVITDFLTPVQQEQASVKPAQQ